MAMGLGRIPGHSGTDFKRRQSSLFFSYFDRKNKKTFNKNIQSSEHKTERKHKTDRSHTNNNVTSLLHLLAILTFTIAFLILFLRGYTLFMSVSTSRNTAKQEVMAYNHQIKNAIPVYLKEGNYYLLDGELDFAQYSYQRVLAMDRRHYRANLGLSNTLYQQCIKHDKYCDDAMAYIKYTKSLSIEHQLDLNRWTMEIQHSVR